MEFIKKDGKTIPVNCELVSSNFNLGNFKGYNSKYKCNNVEYLIVYIKDEALKQEQEEIQSNNLFSERERKNSKILTPLEESVYIQYFSSSKRGSGYGNIVFHKFYDLIKKNGYKYILLEPKNATVKNLYINVYGMHEIKGNKFLYY